MKKAVVVTSHPAQVEIFRQEGWEVAALTPYPKEGALQFSTPSQVLEWSPDLVIFPQPGLGALAKRLRDEGLTVWNGGIFQDKLASSPVVKSNLHGALRPGWGAFIPFPGKGETGEDFVLKILSTTTREGYQWITPGPRSKRVWDRDAILQNPARLLDQVWIEDSPGFNPCAIPLSSIGGLFYTNRIQATPVRLIGLFWGRKFMPQFFLAEALAGGVTVADFDPSPIQEEVARATSILAPLDYCGVVEFSALRDGEDLWVYTIESRVAFEFWAALRSFLPPSQDFLKFLHSAAQHKTFNPTGMARGVVSSVLVKNLFYQTEKVLCFPAGGYKLPEGDGANDFTTPYHFRPSSFFDTMGSPIEEEFLTWQFRPSTLTPGSPAPESSLTPTAMPPSASPQLVPLLQSEPATFSPAEQAS